MKTAGRIAIIISILINLCFGFIFAEYVYNHGGLNYIAERAHLRKTYIATHMDFENQRRMMFSHLPKSPDEILFIGDSMTEGGPWADMFADQKVRNRGIGGSTTRDGTNLVHDGILSGHPRAVFLQYGINDFGAGASIDGFLNQYAELLDAIHQASPTTHIIVQSTIPSQWIVGDSADPDRLEQTNARLKALAQSKGCQYVDVYSAFATGPSRGLPADENVDRLHLNTKGYLIWVDIIRPYVEAAAK